MFRFRLVRKAYFSENFDTSVLAYNDPEIWILRFQYFADSAAPPATYNCQFIFSLCKNDQATEILNRLPPIINFLFSSERIPILVLF